MITNINSTEFMNKGDEFVGLSTDTKPTDNVLNGSLFLELDTGDMYLFDGASGDWVNPWEE